MVRSEPAVPMNNYEYIRTRSYCRLDEARNTAATERKYNSTRTRQEIQSIFEAKFGKPAYDWIGYRHGRRENDVNNLNLAMTDIQLIPLSRSSDISVSFFQLRHMWVGPIPPSASVSEEEEISLLRVGTRLLPPEIRSGNPENLVAVSHQPILYRNFTFCGVCTGIRSGPRLSERRVWSKLVVAGLVSFSASKYELDLGTDLYRDSSQPGHRALTP
ncbi:hypothetical protein IW262DRAFT_1059151 [Armillaria fumosa]|nr:hypothetical protein IW262DRAFT_1059151 [Armillaria fumosa]